MLSLIAGACACAAADRQDLTQIHKAVDNFVRIQTTGLPGQVSFTVGAVDERLNLTSCPALEPFLPAGARLWGNATVGVRCSGAAPWSVYVPVSIRVTGNYIVSARPLTPGQIVSAADLTVMPGDLTQLPAGSITDPAQAIGKTLTGGIAAGQPLRAEWLRQPPVIVQGQSVRLLSQGAGFRVSSEGKALANAADGQLVQVRTAAGQSVSGIARSGSVVEVNF
jgi:flagella basal body P-ring formation protein FlgA